MKITVIKKATQREAQGFCPVFVDDDPMTAKK